MATTDSQKTTKDAEIIWLKTLTVPKYLSYGREICVTICAVFSKLHVHPKPQNMTLFGNKIIADVIRRDHPQSGWALNPMAGVLLKKLTILSSLI